MNRHTFLRGFTMIELLVVIVIIGILAAALVPAVGHFMNAGDEAVSRNNLGRLGKAALIYKTEHENSYPPAGGVFTSFLWTDSRTNHQEVRYGRSRGWVYFEHSCTRSEGDDPSKLGNGGGDGYGLGGIDSATDEGEDSAETLVNEDGCCVCFDSKSKEGGLNAEPASWYSSGGNDGFSPAEVAIKNGCLYDLVGQDLTVYRNPTFVTRAVEKTHISKQRVVRAYAMNVITGADRSLYETRPGYSGVEGGYHAIRYGLRDLKPYVDTSKRADRAVVPARTALLVELDLDAADIKSAGSLSGDQVWDWDEQNESMGFNHEKSGRMYAHVCFADGHVDAIPDPSADSSRPDTTKREKLSKYYGSGGVNASGEKLD